ncbi:MAG TPA: hypothetical protein VF311_00850 [Terriglobales bacterium]
MPNNPVSKLSAATLQRIKIPAELLKQFEQEAEFVKVAPGSTAGLIRVSPEMIEKMGAARLTKMLEQAGFELVIMG